MIVAYGSSVTLIFTSTLLRFTALIVAGKNFFQTQAGIFK